MIWFRFIWSQEISLLQLGRSYICSDAGSSIHRKVCLPTVPVERWLGVYRLFLQRELTPSSSCLAYSSFSIPTGRMRTPWADRWTHLLYRTHVSLRFNVVETITSISCQNWDTDRECWLDDISRQDDKPAVTWRETIFKMFISCNHFFFPPELPSGNWTVPTKLSVNKQFFFF